MRQFIEKDIISNQTGEPVDFLSWEHRKPVQPQKITYANQLDYTNDDLRLVITQLNISKSKQDKLLDEWAEILPTLHHVRQIFFYSSVPQKILDALTQMGNLDSLFIKWSGNRINDFENLKELKALRRLYLGNSTQIYDLNFLKSLSNLEWLEINEQPNMKKIDGIGLVTNLKGLIITGGIKGKQKIENIEQLKSLKKLQYLKLASTYIETEDLSPICDLKFLKYLDLPIYYPMEEYAKIAASLPNCNHGILAYRETGYKCSKCKNGIKVKPMMKNSREICLSCDSEKVDKLINDFDNLKNIWLQQKI